MIPVAALASLPGFEPVTVQVERRGPPTVDALGRVVPATATLVPVQLVVHQATRKQLERAGLDAASDARAFYADVALRTITDDEPADVVQYAGERWELQNLADYGTIGGIWIALGIRVE